MEAVNLKDAALARIRAQLEAEASKATGVKEQPKIKETQVIKPALGAEGVSGNAR